MYHIKKKKLQTLVSRLLALGRAADSEFCLGIVLSVNLEKCYKGYQKPILLFITRLSLKRLIKSSPYHCLIQRYYHSYFASEEKSNSEKLSKVTHLNPKLVHTKVNWMLSVVPCRLFNLSSTRILKIHLLNLINGLLMYKDHSLHRNKDNEAYWN